MEPLEKALEGYDGSIFDAKAIRTHIRGKEYSLDNEDMTYIVNLAIDENLRKGEKTLPAASFAEVIFNYLLRSVNGNNDLFDGLSTRQYLYKAFVDSTEDAKNKQLGDENIRKVYSDKAREIIKKDMHSVINFVRAYKDVIERKQNIAKHLEEKGETGEELGGWVSHYLGGGLALINSAPIILELDDLFNNNASFN